MGANDLFPLIAHSVVMRDDVHASDALSLRGVSSSFRTAVDAILPELMRLVNHRLASLQRIRSFSFHHPKPHEKTESMHLEERDIDQFLSSKFSSRTSSLFAQSIDQLTWAIQLPDQTSLGWPVSAKTDVLHLSPTFASFSSLLNTDACCFCNSSSCSNTYFQLIPNGKGLVVRCSRHCMRGACVRLLPTKDAPLRFNNDHPRMRVLVENILTFSGIHYPFSRSAMVARANDDWNRNVELPFREYCRTTSPASTCRNGLKLLVFDTLETRTTSTPTLQSTLRIDDSHVASAREHVSRVDRVCNEVKEAERRLVDQFVTSNLIDELNRYLRLLDPSLHVLSLHQLNDLLPGSASIFRRLVVDKLRDVKVDRLYTTTIHSLPVSESYATPLIRTVGSCLKMRSVCSSFGAHALSFVSGLCTGLDACASEARISTSLNRDMITCRFIRQMDELGKDVSLSSILLPPPLPLQPQQMMERSTLSPREVACMMHVFDDMDPHSIRVVPNPHDDRACVYQLWIDGCRLTRPLPPTLSSSYGLDVELAYMFEIGIEVGDVKVYIPLQMSSLRASTCAWLDAKTEETRRVLASSPNAEARRERIDALPQSMLLGTLRNGDAPSMRMSDECDQVAAWLQKTLRVMCSHVESRHVGLLLACSDSLDLLGMACESAFASTSSL